MRAWHRLRYFARTAWQGLWTSPVTSAVAVATIAVTLLLGGTFALVLGNMQDLADRFGERLELAAYLEPGLSPREQEDLRRVATTVEGVAKVRLVTEAQALERFEAGVGESLGLAEALEANPLPASLEIRLEPAARTPEHVARVAGSLDGLPGIAEIGEGQQWLEGYGRAVGVVRATGLGFGAVLALATLLIVANTIRLAVYARRDEIEIQTLVGASRTFIAIPFLTEGVLQGLVGAVLALAFLVAVHQGMLPGLVEGLEFLLGYSEPRFLSGGELFALLLAGASLGGLGSGVALVQGWRR